LNGYVPGTTLGITPVDTNGYVLDAWNHPIRYAISNLLAPPAPSLIFTFLSGMKNANSAACPNCGMSWIASQPLLSVCNAAPALGATACTSAATTLTSNAVLVVFSQGKNFPTIGIPDEQANNAGNAFVDHTPNPAGPANGEYDDIMSWVSINTVFSRMVQAGQLP
jgi:hypothetical protein